MVMESKHNLEFYRMMINPDIRGEQAWERRDFSKIPPRELIPLLISYDNLPNGTPKLEYRLNHPELEKWFVEVLGLVPAEGRTYQKNVLNPWEKFEEGERLREEMLEKIK